MISLNEPKKWNQLTSMRHLTVRLIKFAIVRLRGFFIQHLIQHKIRGLVCSLFCHGLIVCTVENRGTPECVCMDVGTCQGCQYLRPMGTEKHLPWTLRGCQCEQKTSTEAASSKKATALDCSPTESPLLRLANTLPPPACLFSALEGQWCCRTHPFFFDHLQVLSCTSTWHLTVSGGFSALTSETGLLLNNDLQGWEEKTRMNMKMCWKHFEWNRNYYCFKVPNP